MCPSHISALFFCAFVASTFTIASSLECYSCNVTLLTESNEDACKGKETLVTCQSPAVCLSTVILSEEGSVKRYTSLKTCNLFQQGQECELFLKNLQAISPTAKLSYYNKKCSTCDKEKCNGYSAASALVPTLFAFIISYILCKLI